MSKDKEDFLSFPIFGIGLNKANEVLKHIGLGEPKIAFSLGFQAAFKALLDSGKIDESDVKAFVELNEEKSDE